MTARGGKRAGSGRKSALPLLRQEIVSVRLSAWLVDQLHQRRTGPRDLGNVIEEGLLRGYRLKRLRNAIERATRVASTRDSHNTSSSRSVRPLSTAP